MEQNPSTSVATGQVPRGVEAAIARLDDVAAMPLDQRPEAFHEIHESLRAALAELDDA